MACPSGCDQAAFNSEAASFWLPYKKVGQSATDIMVDATTESLALLRVSYLWRVYSIINQSCLLRDD